MSQIRSVDLLEWTKVCCGFSIDDIIHPLRLISLGFVRYVVHTKPDDSPSSTPCFQVGQEAQEDPLKRRTQISDAPAMYKNRKVRNRVIAPAEAKSPPLPPVTGLAITPTIRAPGSVVEKKADKKFLDGLTIGILPLNNCNARVALLSKRITEFGGVPLPFRKNSITSFEKATHIIVNVELPVKDIVGFCRTDADKVFLQSSLGKMKYVRCKWLSECFTKGVRLPEDDYSINMLLQEEITRAEVQEQLQTFRRSTSLKDTNIATSSSLNSKSLTKKGDEEKNVDKSQVSQPSNSDDAVSPSADTASSSSRKRNLNDNDSSDYEDSCGELGDEEDLDSSREKDDLFRSGSPAVPNSVTEKYICAQASSSGTKNLNEHLTVPLEKLMNTHKSLGHQFQAMAYGKAISALKNFPKKIQRAEDAKSLRNIGASTLSKITEILENGTCQKVDNLCVDDEVNRAIALFCNIHGVSSKTAIKWAGAKLRTLEELPTKVTLNRVQLIGLKHYHDFLDRIPRSEVEEIELVVKEGAILLQDGLEIVTCGSYRRGKPTCGDVDILISHPDGKSHRNLFGALLDKLRTSGFLTDDLSISEDGAQKKYLGVCRLSKDGSRFRRLDIIVVPYCEFGCALLYFTGSAYFNRSMRAYAHKLSMTLSHQSLNRNVIREKKVKISNGDPFPNLATEKAIFECMRLPYREPQDRDH